MTNEQAVFDTFHSALDVEPPPGALAAVAHRLRTEGRPPASRRPALALALAVAVLAIAVAVALVALPNPLSELNQARPQTRPEILVKPFDRSADVRMVTSTVGWLVQPDGHVLRTTDGGAHWYDVSYTDESGSLFVAVPTAKDWSFPDATHAYVAESPGNGRQGVIVYATADGGQTWRHSALIRGKIQGHSQPRLFFLDRSRGWLLLGTSWRSLPSVKEIYSSQTLYSTVDAGLHWTEIPNTGGTTGSIEDELVFISASTGWRTSYKGLANEQATLLITHDGGASWQEEPLPIDRSDIGRGKAWWLDPPIFSTELHGLVIAHGFDGKKALTALFATSDGGRTWDVRHLPGELQELVFRRPEDMDALVRFRDPDHGWVVAGSAVELPRPVAPDGALLPLYVTADGGLTWTRVPTNLPLETNNGRITDVQFIDDRRGFALRGLYYSGVFTEMLSTADGGRTWVSMGGR
jgi:photosystem II stability/assembly factor-like uncharacterized protein